MLTNYHYSMLGFVMCNNHCYERPLFSFSDLQLNMNITLPCSFTPNPPVDKGKFTVSQIQTLLSKIMLLDQTSEKEKKDREKKLVKSFGLGMSITNRFVHHQSASLIHVDHILLVEYLFTRTISVLRLF